VIVVLGLFAAFTSEPAFAIDNSKNNDYDLMQPQINNNKNSDNRMVNSSTKNNNSTISIEGNGINKYSNNSSFSKLATDNNGNTIISNNTKISVAFVRPTFTYAAYQKDGFYNFYNKYSDTKVGTNVTKDLNLLTVKVPHKPILNYNDKPSDTPPPPREKEYIEILMEHVKVQISFAGGVNISDITDKEVHDGLIFANDKGDRSNTSSNNNAYDVLFLFHQEYATQKEYDNLKKFVANGGTIVFNDANILTTEVKYNSTNDSITLVRGHDWQYDEKSAAAWPAEKERWTNETQQWVGSNFKQDLSKIE